MKQASTGRIVILCCLLSLAACAGPPPFAPAVAPLYFKTHMIVIEPEQRWQATVDWRASDADDGLARLAHIATGRIVELRWQAERTWLRDNQAESTSWRRIQAKQLMLHGISALPSDIMLFLDGKTPPGFVREQADKWRGKRFGRQLSISWDAGKRRLSLHDVDGDRRVMFGRL